MTSNLLAVYHAVQRLGFECFSTELSILILYRRTPECLMEKELVFFSNGAIQLRYGKMTGFNLFKLSNEIKHLIIYKYESLGILTSVISTQLLK